MAKIVIFQIIALLSVAGIIFHSCNDPEQSKTGFGIYLAETDELILSDEHIQSYNRIKHAIELNKAGIYRWDSYVFYDKSTDPPQPQLSGGLFGKEFKLNIDGEVIYRGKIWSAVSSGQCPGITIYDAMGDHNGALLIGVDNNIGPSPVKKDDPRENQKLFSYFRGKGLLN